MKKLIVCYVVLYGTIIAQALLYPKLPSDYINDMYFLNENEILFINDGGCIYKSYDGGNTWELKRLFQGQKLKSIEFVNDKVGFVFPEKQANILSMGVIYTDDGGENWSDQYVSFENSYAILPLSENTLLKATWAGNIERLENFYNSWDTVYTIGAFPVYFEECINDTVLYANGHFTKFQLLPSGNVLALAVNDGAYYNGRMSDSLSFILKSNDEGLTWDTLWIGSTNMFDNISMCDDSTGIMSCNSKIFKTTNGGKEWKELLINCNDNNIWNVVSIDPEHFIFLTNNQAFKTSDGGLTWKAIDIIHQRDFNVSFYNETLGFIYGNSILKTVDGGLNWNIIKEPYTQNIYDLDFISEKKGFAHCDDGLYKTINGGENWEKLFDFGGSYGKLNQINSIRMINDSTGWLVCKVGELYKTSNGGNSWEKVDLDSRNELYEGIEFLDSKLGIIYFVSVETSPNSHIYEAKYHLITTDGGKTWEKRNIVNSAIMSPFTKVQFVNPQKLLALNSYGLWLSKDTAETWERIYSEGDYLVGGTSFNFYDSTFGIMTRSYVFKTTTDGGYSWNDFEKPTYCDPNDCVLLGQNMWGNFRGIEIGDGGVMIEYNFDKNGQVNFSRAQSTFTNMPLYKCETFVKDNFPYYWACGGGSTIIFRQYEKTFTDIDKIDELPSKYNLSQNYPNPFNPTTTINYELPKASRVELKIYDILGREIKTLVDEYQQPGIHNSVFNTENSSLSSGVYFYKLKADTYLEVKKMLLLK